MMSFALLGLIGILWVLYGYSLSFGPDAGGIIGKLDWIGLSGVGQEPSDIYASTVPHLAFMVFQSMFAIIAVALWIGGIVEFLPKVKVEVIVMEEDLGKALSAIVRSARTGERGDGKIFVLPVENAVRIRTGDQAESAIQD